MARPTLQYVGATQAQLRSATQRGGTGRQPMLLGPPKLPETQISVARRQISGPQRVVAPVAVVSVSDASIAAAPASMEPPAPAVGPRPSWLEHASNSRHSASDEIRIGMMSIGSFPVDVDSIVSFAEGLFEYDGIPVTRVQVIFNDSFGALDPRFELDNLVYALE